MNDGETTGLIGTLFGVAACGVLVIGALGTVQTSSCSMSKSQNTLRLQAKCEVLRQRHELLSQAIYSRDKDFAEIIAAISEAQQLLVERQAKLRKTKEEVEAADRDYHTTKSDLEVYQRRYQEMARLKAPGESLGDLKIRTGAVYYDVFIQCVTDAGLEIRHRTGKARLAPEDLPVELQKRFQWDPDKTAEMRAREKQAADAFQTVVTEKRKVSGRDASIQSTSTAISRLSLLRYQIYKARSAYNDAIARTHLIRGTRFASRRLGGWEDQARQLGSTTNEMLREIEQLEQDLLILERTLERERSGNP